MKITTGELWKDRRNSTVWKITHVDTVDGYVTLSGPLPGKTIIKQRLREFVEHWERAKD